jgi:hypothetical protein
MGSIYGVKPVATILRKPASSHGMSCRLRLRHPGGFRTNMFLLRPLIVRQALPQQIVIGITTGLCATWQNMEIGYLLKWPSSNKVLGRSSARGLTNGTPAFS